MQDKFSRDADEALLMIGTKNAVCSWVAHNGKAYNLPPHLIRMAKMYKQEGGAE